MSWLKNRIHPLQPRYVAAACALCLAVGGGAAGYWLLTWSTEPAATSQVAGLDPEFSEAPAAGESSSSPPKRPPPTEAADPILP